MSIPGVMMVGKAGGKYFAFGMAIQEPGVFDRPMNFLVIEQEGGRARVADRECASIRGMPIWCAGPESKR